MSALFTDISNQSQAVAALRMSALRPVHAYLLVGPPGVGKAVAAREFAAALLCPDGGDGTCDVCRRVRIGAHPDVIVIEREGAAISIDTAREVVRAAARSPVEGARKVLVLSDFHLVRDAGPALLKTIEEPPPSTVFVLTAEHVPSELATVASRCVRVDFSPLTSQQVMDILIKEGVDSALASDLAQVSAGRLDRARLLADDAAFKKRRDAWQSVPSRLDGTGATAAIIADQLIALVEESMAPLLARQQGEAAALEERTRQDYQVNGKVGRVGRAASRSGMRELEERHRREIRRLRTDELRAGLATVAGVYRDRLVGGDCNQSDAVHAIALIQDLAAKMLFNPGELLALQALLVRLSRIGS